VFGFSGEACAEVDLGGAFERSAFVSGSSEKSSELSMSTGLIGVAWLPELGELAMLLGGLEVVADGLPF
jgi:hypothetical protein